MCDVVSTLSCSLNQKPVVSLLRELRISGQRVRKIVKEVSDEAVKSSQWIWIRKAIGGTAGGSLRVNRLFEEARKKSRIYLSGGCGQCEPFWNQVAISGELACMALFLLAFLVTVGLFRWVCLLNLIVCLVLPPPLAPSLLSLPPTQTRVCIPTTLWLVCSWWEAGVACVKSSNGRH